MSWYSSTLIQRLRAWTTARASLVGLEQLDRPDEHVVEVDPAGPLLGPFVVGVQAGEQLDRDRRRAAAVGRQVRAYVAGVIRRLFAHSISSARSFAGREPVAARAATGRGGPRSGSSRPGSRASARRRGGPARSSRAGSRAWAWNVRAVTPGWPRPRQARGHLAGGLVGERDDEDVAGAARRRSRSRRPPGG